MRGWNRMIFNCLAPTTHILVSRHRFIGQIHWKENNLQKTKERTYFCASASLSPASTSIRSISSVCCTEISRRGCTSFSILFWRSSASSFNFCAASSELAERSPTPSDWMRKSHLDWVFKKYHILHMYDYFWISMKAVVVSYFNWMQT